MTPRVDGLIGSIASIEDRYLPLRDLARQLEREVAALTTQRDEQEELHRLQLVAITVVSFENSRNSAARMDRSYPYWTPAYQDVATAIDREIAERERAEAAEAQQDELQKRIGYSAVPLAAGCANLDDSLRMQGLMWAVLLIAEAHAKNGLALDKAICDEARQFLENRLATGTESTTTLPTNGTEGLRAELDAAKRALATVDDLYNELVALQECMDEEGRTDEQIISAMFDHSCAAIRRIMQYRGQTTIPALAAKSPLG